MPQSWLQVPAAFSIAHESSDMDFPKPIQPSFTSIFRFYPFQRSVDFVPKERTPTHDGWILIVHYWDHWYSGRILGLKMHWRGLK